MESAIKENVKTFIKAVRINRAALLGKWQGDNYNLDVFEAITQAVVVQFRQPDFACIAFTHNAQQPDLFV